MTIAVFVLSLLGAMALGMPIAYALLVCGLSLMAYMASNGMINAFDSQILAQRFVDGADNFPLLAVPFFLLAGEFMNAGGLSRRIVNLAMAWVGHFRGGLGYVAVMAAVIMASLSGSAVADTAALAALLIPMMKRAGYNVGRSAGLIASGGIIAPVIPPSIGFIIFGVAANVSITKLFLAGIVPGLLMGVAIGLTWWWVAKRENVQPGPRMKLAEKLQATRQGILALGLPVFIIGGMKFGVPRIAVVQALRLDLGSRQDHLGHHVFGGSRHGQRMAHHGGQHSGRSGPYDGATHGQQDLADGGFDALGHCGGNGAGLHTNGADSDTRTDAAGHQGGH